MSNPFPVNYSTLCTTALEHHVLTRYSIGNITNCQLWNRGLSDVYLVETEHQRYVLRISHADWRSGNDIQFEMELLYFLRQKSIPVAAPLQTQSGDLSVTIDAPEGKRFATLHPYAPGKIALGDMNQEQSRILGKTLAQLHKASLSFHTDTPRQALTLDYLIDQSLAVVIPAMHHVGQIEYLQATADHLHQVLQDLPQTAPYWVICWGDPHSGNVHFTPNQVPTLFDFDQCGYGWRSFDVAKFLQMALCSGMRYSVRDAFVEGYQQVQPLSDRELAALAPLTQVAHLWRWAISLNYALKHESSRVDDYYFLHRVGQLKMLKSYDWQAMQVVSR
jgi:Ser/Thr protein kinase RdoA (MazF antagonist)